MRVIKVNSQTEPDKPSLAVNDEKARTREKINWNNKAVYPYLKDCGRILMAVGLSFLAYFISTALFPEGMNFYWKQVAGLVIGGMVLLIINYAVKTESNLSNAVAVALFLPFVFRVSYHYFENNKGQDKETENKEAVTGKMPVQSICEVLLPGTYLYDLKAGEETNWLSAPEGGTFNANLSSPSYGYKIKFSDKTEYDGGPDVVIPKKVNVSFKILAKVDEAVKVIMK